MTEQCFVESDLLEVRNAAGWDSGYLNHHWFLQQGRKDGGISS